MNIESHLRITPPTPISLFTFQNKVPLLSVEALHHLHIFIFVLAVVHVTFSVLTVVFGGARVSSMPPFPSSTQLFSFFFSSLFSVHAITLVLYTDSSVETLGRFNCKTELRNRPRYIISFLFFP